jgi:hypothetical protein
VDKGGEQKAPSRRNHPGAVRERSQGLSLRNPWIDSVGQSHPGGMREKTQISPDPFLASLRDALSRTMQPGVSKTQPLATIFDALYVGCEGFGSHPSFLQPRSLPVREYFLCEFRERCLRVM